MKPNKKTIYYGITILTVIIVLLIAHSIFFKCSIPYAVSCYYQDSSETKNISCISDKDCSVENMNSFCIPGRPTLLKCGSSKYYCDNGYCKGCDCIGQSYDISKRQNGVYEKRDER
ncbi:MAG: hypothetical protein DRN71_00150 [Candidatus Nanohalarchaeota archaeon]|nr:MAG: hypothetical protein DRN71_00150 [Candidatus Nanohaloarchaeota archaeon]